MLDNKLILKRMKELGLNTEALSKLSNIPLGTLNKIVYGVTKNPTIENLQDIAAILECKVDDFLTKSYDEEKDVINTIAAHRLYTGDLSEEEITEIEEFKKYVISKRNK